MQNEPEIVVENTAQEQVSKTNDGKKLIGPILIIIGIIVALVLLIKVPANNNDFGLPKTSQDLENVKNEQNIPDQNLKSTDHVLGDLNSRLIIFEYSDLDCPFCSRFHPTMKQVQSEYSGQLAWVYRHFPLDNLHPQARTESTASECVAKLAGNDAFWRFLDDAFAYTSSSVSDPLPTLTGFAMSAGVNREAFLNCMNDKEIAGIIKADEDLAQKSGAQGTPYSVIYDTKNNAYYPVPGAVDADTLREIIKTVLAE